MLYFAYRDKLSGVFVRFRAPLHQDIHTSNCRTFQFWIGLGRMLRKLVDDMEMLQTATKSPIKSSNGLVAMVLRFHYARMTTELLGFQNHCVV
jgi:hypothetical protein